MHDFNYRRPGGLSSALEAFAEAEDGQYLAGGQTTIPVMKLRLAMPTDVIDLAGIEELRGISVSDSAVTIGAMTTHSEVASSADVRGAIPVLAEMAGGIGDAHVRNRGTLGGSIANNDPAADYPAAVVGLGATVHTDRRQIPGDEFFPGIFETALEEGELITRVDFPIPEAAAYAKFKNPASRFALVGVLISRGPKGVRVAVTGAGPCVFRIPGMEEALSGNFTAGALNGISVPADDLNTAIHASAAYRAHLIGVMARRVMEGMV